MPPPALTGRRVVLGVCGGIAAYKAVEVCRRLVDAGAFVSPVLTPTATKFVGALTFSALASEPARTSLWDGPEPIPHTRLGQQADVVVVVPATARLIGAYAAGISSDLLTATLLATRAPVVVCPAMHTEMWEHPAVVDNLALLARRGVHIVEPADGRLAGGDVGRGRLAEPERIVAAVARAAGAPASVERGDETGGGVGAERWNGLRVVVTAGGTREPIDAVRYIGNRSSGKQGHAIAEAFAARRATVTLVTTVPLPTSPGIEVINVETAAQMGDAVRRHAEGAAVIVMAAAVADFRPTSVVAHKLKKVDGVPDIALELTADILAGLGVDHPSAQTLVGFAAETVARTSGGPDGDGSRVGDRDRLVDYARTKLASKGADLIVANDVAAADVGFGHDTNAVVIVTADGTVTDIDLRSKPDVAIAVVDAVERYRRRAAYPNGSAPPGQAASAPGGVGHPTSPPTPPEEGL